MVSFHLLDSGDALAATSPKTTSDRILVGAEKKPTQVQSPVFHLTPADRVAQKRERGPENVHILASSFVMLDLARRVLQWVRSEVVSAVNTVLGSDVWIRITMKAGVAMQYAESPCPVVTLSTTAIDLAMTASVEHVRSPSTQNAIVEKLRSKYNATTERMSCLAKSVTKNGEVPSLVKIPAKGRWIVASTFAHLPVISRTVLYTTVQVPWTLFLIARVVRPHCKSLA